MRQRKAFFMLSVFTSASALLLSLAITPSSGQGAYGQEDVIAKRQEIMKTNGANVRELRNKEKEGKIKEIAVNAQSISDNLSKALALFPEGSTSDKSRAKPEIWKDKAKFEQLGKDAKAAADQLQKVASAGDAAAVKSQITKLGDACAACHTQFRKPEEAKKSS